MSFDELIEDAHSVLRNPDVFGKSVKIRRADGSAEFEVDAVANDEETAFEQEGVQLSSTIHSLGLQLSSIPWSPVKQDLVLRDGDTWVVADVLPEGEGFLTLELHKA